MYTENCFFLVRRNLAINSARFNRCFGTVHNNINKFCETNLENSAALICRLNTGGDIYLVNNCLFVTTYCTTHLILYHIF